MRLINVKTLELKEFFHDLPPYAILSHTWSHEEVTFQEYLLATGPNAKHHVHITRKAGFPKIVGACKRAHADGLQYLWCDTNCIDKSSSAELSEAINSMYAWYRDSKICYAYLVDVDAGVDFITDPRGIVNPGSFKDSRWFTRGWTLQELLAPKRVVFFDRQWTILGDRKDLADDISKITRIHVDALYDRNKVHEYSIAQRMSWAADRATSRREDVAYCLMGIFDISMPLLYGEGPKAFIRLQMEILKVSDDQSLLAWDLGELSKLSLSSALAPSPSEFRHSGSIVRDYDLKGASCTLANIGILIELPVMKTLSTTTILVGLNCAMELKHEPLVPRYSSMSQQPKRQFQVWIALRHLQQDTYVRDHHSSSKVFFGPRYATLSTTNPRRLFLSLHVPQISVGPKTAAWILGRERVLLASGILTTVAAGQLGNTRHRIMGETYLLDDVAIVSLRNRHRTSISHQLISSGNYSVVLSVFWDLNVHPREWLYTVIFDPSMRIMKDIARSEKWECLFGGRCVVEQNRCCSSVSALHSIHHRLRQLQADGVVGTNPPLVTVQSGNFKDSSGQKEVLVDILFQESATFPIVR